MVHEVLASQSVTDLLVLSNTIGAQNAWELVVGIFA